MPNYGDPKYWDDRYRQQRDTTYDWLENYETLKPLLDNIIARDQSILNVGCGNAELTEDMYDDGYSNIVNTDISPIVIQNMMMRNKHRVGMRWDVDDVLNMQHEDETFDVVVDKSTLDAILCGKQSFMNAAIMLSEVQRVLKTGGIYLIISYGNPTSRTVHLQRAQLSFDVECLLLRSSRTLQGENNSRESEHFCYVCVKKHDAGMQYLKNWSRVKSEIEEEMSEEDEDLEEDDEEEGKNILTIPLSNRIEEIDQMLAGIKKHEDSSDIQLEVLCQSIGKLRDRLVDKLGEIE